MRRRAKILQSLLVAALLGAAGAAIARAADEKAPPAEAAKAADADKDEGGGEGLLNKLLAPGPLISGHKDLEHSDCLSCHTPRKGVPDSKCLDCHKDIRKSVEKKAGFHGLTSKTCIQCHSDHKGRDFDSTKVDQAGFDHKVTGYALEGKHAELKCSECHKETRGKVGKATRKSEPHYFGAKTTNCASCHKKDDPHFFTGKFAQKDCISCHGLKSWKKDVAFVHSKDAHYKLEGRHALLKCAECHVPKGGKPVYTWPNLKGSKCLACHADQHKSNLGPRFRGGDCLKCHTQSEWKVDDFDHGITGWQLKGAHADLECQACHKQAPEVKARKNFKFTGLRKECLACHKDVHAFGSFRSDRLRGSPNTCLPCHTESHWKPVPRWDHNQNTRFPIEGQHIKLDCAKCHVKSPRSAARAYHWNQLAEKTCELCHKSPHTKSFTPELLKKKCTECHVAEGWQVLKRADGKRFDHSLTRFPLTGKHKELGCKQCHTVGGKQVYKFQNHLTGFCVDCHKNPHVNQFHSAFSNWTCSECHTTTTFKERREFDHSMTEFRLTGKHASLKCADCHTPTAEWLPVNPPRHKSKFIFDSGGKQFCVDCHKNPHVGQFHSAFSDRVCTSCHTTRDFTNRLPFHHEETYFQLKGKHATVACVKCHVATRELMPTRPPKLRSKFLFPEIWGKDCGSCHKDPHKGEFGQKCSECHTEETWKRTGDFHKNFTLSGIHYSLECTECHKDGRRLAGMSDKCVLCHQKDDIHNGTLPDCGSCHRQQFWENTEFKHSMTNFPLRGIHRTLDCYACHYQGTYKGTPSQCVNCHLNDALNYTGVPNHSTLIGRSCYDCHNQFSFQ